MKTQTNKRSLITTLAILALPVMAFAQADRPTERPTSPTTPGTIRPGSESWDKQLNDTATLFRQLDADKDGKLSSEEFAKIRTVLNAPSGHGTDRTIPNRTDSDRTTNPGEKPANPSDRTPEPGSDKKKE